MRVVDLFCGSGGLSKGLIDSGMEVVAAYDNWQVCVDTYNRNIACHAEVLDLSNVSEALEAIRPHSPDLIAGGPPCQDFSSAGKRVEAGRASLTRNFAEIVAFCRPDFFLMENVPRARTSETFRHLTEILDAYDLEWAVLDASVCGVPQRRKRFFVFGAIKRERQMLDWMAENISDEPLSVKQHLGDEIDIEHYYRHPRNYSRRSVFSVHEPSPTIRGVNRPVPPNYQGNSLDKVPPRTVRPLTTMERSRIQTFPPEWAWDARDRNADAELQIGNAVPPALAEFVGKAILYATE